MYGRIGRVRELLGHKKSAGVGSGQFFGPAYGTGHALCTGGEHQLCAQHGHHAAALKAHGFGHGERKLIPLGGGHIG